MKLDLKEWLAKVTRQAELKTLLWTNPNPTASFGAQTIQLDLSGYDAVEVISKPYATQSTYFTSKGEVGNGSGIIFSQTGYGNPVRIYGTQRPYTATSTGIVFDNALDFSASVSNAYCVPCKIYGIKSGGGYCLTVFSRLTGVLRHRKAVA